MYFTFGYDWISSYDMVKKKGGRETNTITNHMDVILFVDSWLLGRCKCKFDDTAPLRIYLLYPHYPVNTNAETALGFTLRLPILCRKINVKTMLLYCKLYLNHLLSVIYVYVLFIILL